MDFEVTITLDPKVRNPIRDGIREKYGMAARIAETTGIPKALITQWLDGIRTMPWDRAQAIAEAVGYQFEVSTRANGDAHLKLRKR